MNYVLNRIATKFMIPFVQGARNSLPCTPYSEYFLVRAMDKLRFSKHTESSSVLNLNDSICWVVITDFNLSTIRYSASDYPSYVDVYSEREMDQCAFCR
jgi:hypothetical protein